MVLILLGPPGAGKGTQAERLQKSLNLNHVSSGHLFRENIEKETALGLRAKQFIDKGELVPDGITIAMVRKHLEQLDQDNGVVLDGFPRTLAQVEGLDIILHDMHRDLDGVLFIAVGDEELVSRLSGRRICRRCQTPYHIPFNPPQKDNHCDVCGGQLYQREDDKPKTVRARLAVYHKQTIPLIAYYQDKRLLTKIDGTGDIDAVSDALQSAVRILMGRHR